MITAIIGWFAARKIALLIYSFLAMVAVGAAFGLVQHGKTVARAECDSAAKQARIDALERDLKIVADRGVRDAETIVSLREQLSGETAKIQELASDLAETKLQSTAPGAKTDANALLDDRCNYTARGARRVRE